MRDKILISELPYNKETRSLLLEKSEFIYTTPMWIDFLLSEKTGDLLILEIVRNKKSYYFISFVFKKMFVKICGSPFEGWSTPYMGFIGISKEDDDTKINLLKSVRKYILGKKHCMYFQIEDWHLDLEFAKKYKLKYEINCSPIVDITRSEEDLFMSFKTDVRTNCRNFEKRGAHFKVEHPSEKFGEDYYNELVDVFDKQNLQSYYSLEKIQNLMKSFSEYNEYIYCANVYDPSDTKSIATGIFLGFKERFYFFGAASYREYQLLRPNEYVVWSAIKHWKAHGCKVFDMCGVRKYKEKFSPVIDSHPIIYFSKVPGLLLAKRMMKSIILRKRKKK